MTFKGISGNRHSCNLILICLLPAFVGCQTAEPKEPPVTDVREANGEALMQEMDCVKDDCKLEVFIINTSKEAVMFDINGLSVPGFTLVEKLPITKRLEYQRQERILVKFRKLSPTSKFTGEGAEVEYVIRFAE